MKFIGADYSGQYASFTATRTLLADFRGNLARLLAERFAVSPEVSAAIASSLYWRMDVPALRYHTPLHILSMLSWASANRLELDPAVELAAWFHDAIYDPTAGGDNERRSADFMRAALAGCVPPQVVSRSADAVIATGLHMQPDIEPGFGLLLDMDLCNLAWDEANFAASSRALADELVPVVGEQRFLAGRRQFLSDLLGRGFIFRTEAVRSAHEQIARQNIEGVLSATRACYELCVHRKT